MPSNNLTKNKNKIKKSSKSELVNAANDKEDLLSDFPPFKLFDRNGLKAVISIHRSTELATPILHWAFQLTKENMKHIYEESGAGWNDKDKMSELCHKSALIILIRDTSGESDENQKETEGLIGFCHFRFDLDYGVEVLYCYELQLTREVRGKGLGKFVLQLLELLAFKNKMKKVILTVSKCNVDALSFYRKQKYIQDETSPNTLENLTQEVHYEILSKSTVPKTK